MKIQVKLPNELQKTGDDAVENGALWVETDNMGDSGGWNGYAYKTLDGGSIIYVPNIPPRKLGFRTVRHG